MSDAAGETNGEPHHGESHSGSANSSIAWCCWCIGALCCAVVATLVVAAVVVIAAMSREPEKPPPGCDIHTFPAGTTLEGNVDANPFEDMREMTILVGSLGLDAIPDAFDACYTGSNKIKILSSTKLLYYSCHYGSCLSSFTDDGEPTLVKRRTLTLESTAGFSSHDCIAAAKPQGDGENRITGTKTFYMYPQEDRIVLIMEHEDKKDRPKLSAELTPSDDKVPAWCHHEWALLDAEDGGSLGSGPKI